MQAKRARGLALTKRDRQNAGANNLSDESRGEGDKSEHERGHFRDDLESPFEIEAGQPGDIELERRPGRSYRERRESDDERGGNEHSRHLCAGPVLSPPSPYVKSDPGNDRYQGRSQKPHGGGPRDRHWQVEAAVVEKDDGVDA